MSPFHGPFDFAAARDGRGLNLSPWPPAQSKLLPWAPAPEDVVERQEGTHLCGRALGGTPAEVSGAQPALTSFGAPSHSACSTSARLHHTHAG